MIETLILKIIIVIIITFLVCIVKYKKGNIFFRLSYFVLIFFSVIFSSSIVNLFPVPVENITITALHQKNIEAKGDEIYLIGIYGNDKEIKLKTATEDKWFWQGTWYIWRNSSDMRKPRELPDSFILELPIGSNRYIEFFTNKYKGLVQIEYMGDVQIADCYSQENGTCKIYINDTGQIKILKHIIILLLIFGIVYFFAFIISTFLWEKLKQPQYLEIIKSFFINQWDKIIYLLIAIASFLLMVSLGWENHKLWHDEIANVGFVFDQSFKNVVLANAIMIDVNPPLFNILAYFWLKIMPYGFEYLFLLCEILTAFSVFFIGLSGAYIKNKFTGIVAAVLMGFSPSVILYIGYEFRPAPLFLFTSSLTYWLYLKKVSGDIINAKTLINLSFAYTIMALTHYYGILIILSLFLVDCLQYFCKKIKINFFIPYLVSGIIEIFWFGIVFLYNQRNITKSWKFPPNINSIINLIKYYFCSGNEWMQVLFIITCSGILVYGFHAISERKIFSNVSFKFLIVLFVIIFSITIPYVYSAFINPDGPLFDSRYFTGILPLAILILAYGIAVIKDFIRHFTSNSCLFSFMIFLSVFINSVVYSYTTVTHDLNAKSGYVIPLGSITLYSPFERAAEYIMKQNDIYSPSTAVVSTISDGDGYYGFMYLLTKKHERDAVVLLRNDKVTDDILQYQKLYVCELRAGKAAINDVILENYNMVDENLDLRIKIFERKIEEA